MWLLLVPVCLAIFNLSPILASEPHYVIVVPTILEQGTEEKACVTFLDLKGEVNVKLELKNEDQVHPVAEHKINTHDYSDCFNFQVPLVKEDRSVWHLHVSAHGEHINVDDSKKVIIVKLNDVCVIQTDKSTYKPGDTVKFRLMTLNNNLQATNNKHPLIEITNPSKQRIVQWLHVSTTERIVDFSFHLANELALGYYKINIPDSCEKSFQVDEYVLRRFELNIKTPSSVALKEKSFHLDACGSYTYRKPVEGFIDISVCSEQYYHGYSSLTSFNEEEEKDRKNCMTIKGEKTDSKGCLSREIELGYFNFSATEQAQFLEINAELTEETTGHNEKASAAIHISEVKNTIEFVDCENLFQTGHPYHGKVKVVNEKKEPMANEAVTVYRIHYDSDRASSVKVVTDLKGIAQFNFNTSDWEKQEELKVRFSSHDHDDLHVRYYGFSVPEAYLWLRHMYSKSQSILSIEKHSSDVSCQSDQSVTVEYDIHKKILDSDTDHLHFFYFFMTINGIVSYKEHKVDIKDQANSPNLHGSFPLNFHVENEFFPGFTVFVFAVLPNGETIARSTDYNVSPCVEKKMKLSFSEDQVRPREHVSLEVTAEPGSVCSVRSVDKGYLLEKPHEDSYFLTHATENLRNRFNFYYYMYDSLEPQVHQCPENTTAEREDSFDVHSLFLIKHLHIFSNTQITEPVTCVPNHSPQLFSRSGTKRKETDRKDKEIQKRFTRSYFPDTWLFELVHVSSDGHSVLNVTTPDSITMWMTDAVCLGTTGIATASDVELTTFQPHFLDLIVPYSVVQGEKITVQAVVFSYVKTCILVVASLSNSEDLITAQDKDQARCVCEGHSHSFSWDVSTLKPKALKIRVDSGAIEVKGDCTEDVLLIGEDHRTDSVEKTIVVKPKGYEDEDTKTFLLFPSDTREAIAININAPERLVPGSERAHVIVHGDLLANIAVNLENLLFMPNGCGEQNMAKFYRYVCTLEYLLSVKELTPEMKTKMIEALMEGYQHQLTFRNTNGSFVYFQDGDENIWLTAFTIRGLSGAQKFIYINEDHIQKSVTWLRSKQEPDGSFIEVGYYYNNELEADNAVTRTAYVTIALLENHAVHNGSIVEDAMSYLKKSVDHVKSAYTLSLLAYVFTLSGDNEQRDQALKKLEEKAVKKEGMKHWETSSYSEGEVETASYAVLALLSHKVITMKDLEDCGDIIRWIVTNQHAGGGFYSSQDTTIALQALAKYAKAINNRKGDATVTITSKSGFQKTVHLDKSNSLLVQTVDLPEVPGEYSLSVTGDGFAYVQSHLHYNVLPEHSEKGHFSFNISTEPSACSHVSQKRFDVHMDVRYSGKREHTNMALITLVYVSGYVADKNSVEKLKKNPLVEKTEISAENITIYLKKLTHEPLNLVFSMEREAHVENVHPGNAVVYDYYDPEEYTVTDYSAPCTSVIAHCAVSAAEREDCGFSNISKNQCEQKGCCFDSNTPGTKWCFFQGFKKAENH